jgi:hypothetical protein
MVVTCAAGEFTMLELAENVKEASWILYNSNVFFFLNLDRSLTCPFNFAVDQPRCDSDDDREHS